MTDPETNPETDPMRTFAHELFKPDPEDDETDEQQKPPGDNVVPREGANLRPAPDPDKAMRAFVSELFDNNA